MENENDSCERVLQTHRLLMDLWERIRQQEIERCRESLKTLEELCASTHDKSSRDFWMRYARNILRRWNRLQYEYRND